jgi:hypothetical protein
MLRWTMVVAGFILTVTACSSIEGVHPNKPSSQYTNDYNRCAVATTGDLLLEQGS